MAAVLVRSGAGVSGGNYGLQDGKEQQHGRSMKKGLVDGKGKGKVLFSRIICISSSFLRCWFRLKRLVFVAN